MALGMQLAVSATFCIHSANCGTVIVGGPPADNCKLVDRAGDVDRV